MSSYSSSTVSLAFLFTIAITWIAIASVQVGANVLQRDLYGPANGQFLAGYPDDHDSLDFVQDATETDNPDPDRDRSSASRNHIFRALDSPYGAMFLDQSNARDPSMGSKSFGLFPSDRSLLEPSAKRNIDEIDRTAFDNFFKRNLDEIDPVDWDGFVKGLVDYLTSRTNRPSRMHSMQLHG
ncbi:orcokinin peptides-like isoform X2 [Osmia bicornis bicornis]|uniref:orcokinin peptides-like isoform X2 n=1 Tax=Osmia bicornis bicornis TaxID=1437191 RepID=UPI0010F4DB1B|nr:orcokinin peptides-like isoform X2 [Osmia bicornis bicornis]